MSGQLLAVIIGGLIGIVGSTASMIIISALSHRRRSNSIRAVVQAEVTAIREKAQRFINGESTVAELGASAPMLTTIATEIGFLSPQQAVSFRRAVTLDMEMRVGGNREEAAQAVSACEDALERFSGTG